MCHDHDKIQKLLVNRNIDVNSVQVEVIMPHLKWFIETDENSETQNTCCDSCCCLTHMASISDETIWSINFSNAAHCNANFHSLRKQSF